MIWECACGEGHLSKALEDNGYKVVSTDLVNRGYGISGIDFLEAKEMLNDSANILTNPPYKYAQEFVEHSLKLLPEGGKCLMFLKLTFLEGKARKKLFRENPPKTVYVSSGRLQCAMNGDFEKYKKVGTAVAYAWYEWEKGYKGKTVVEWIN